MTTQKRINLIWVPILCILVPACVFGRHISSSSGSGSGGVRNVTAADCALYGLQAAPCPTNQYPRDAPAAAAADQRLHGCCIDCPDKCPIGQGKPLDAQSCDPRGDTVCQKCLQGVTWNTGLNYLPCQPCTDCSDLHRTVRAECVPSADTRCSHCHIGFHDVEGACIPCPEKSAHAECLRKTKQLPNMASFNTTYEDEYGDYDYDYSSYVPGYTKNIGEIAAYGFIAVLFLLFACFVRGFIKHKYCSERGVSFLDSMSPSMDFLIKLFHSGHSSASAVSVQTSEDLSILGSEMVIRRESSEASSTSSQAAHQDLLICVSTDPPSDTPSCPASLQETDKPSMISQSDMLSPKFRQSSPGGKAVALERDSIHSLGGESVPSGRPSVHSLGGESVPSGRPSVHSLVGESVPSGRPSVYSLGGESVPSGRPSVHSLGGESVPSGRPSVHSLGGESVPSGRPSVHSLGGESVPSGRPSVHSLGGESVPSGRPSVHSLGGEKSALPGITDVVSQGEKDRNVPQLPMSPHGTEELRSPQADSSGYDSESRSTGTHNPRVEVRQKRRRRRKAGNPDADQQETFPLLNNNVSSQVIRPASKDLRECCPPLTMEGGEEVPLVPGPVTCGRLYPDISGYLEPPGNRCGEGCYVAAISHTEGRNLSPPQESEGGRKGADQHFTEGRITPRVQNATLKTACYHKNSIEPGGERSQPT